MTYFFRTWQGFWAGFIYASLALVPAYGDDTEIYFGGGSIASDGSVQPNIMFVLDTSGSMAWDFDQDWTSSNERLDALKAAMNSFLDSASNVNVGLMRYTNPGGPVLHKVEDVDALSGNGRATITRQVDNSQSDATELVVGGAVTLSDSILELEEKYTGLTNLVKQTSAQTDLATELRTNDANDTSFHIGHLWNTSCPALIDRYHYCDSGSGTLLDTYVGVRFDSLGIPKDSMIFDAALIFGVDDQQSGGDGENSDDLTVTIYAEAKDSGAFDFNNDFDVSSRVSTAANHEWEINTNPSSGDTLVTGDLTPIMTELVEHADWTTGSAATFILSEGASSIGGRREIDKANESGKPILAVTYAASRQAQAVGLRFSDIKVPSKATITSAYLVFQAASTNDDAATYSIAAQDIYNAPEFQTVNNDIRGRTKTTNQVTWSSVEDWEEGEEYRSPDLTAMVQELVNIDDSDSEDTIYDGWCGGNAMAFILEGSNTGRRVATAYDDAPGAAPQLVIEYDMTSVPEAGGCTNAELSYQVAADADDTSQEGNNATSTSGDNLVLKSTKKRIGLRFNGLAIPQGADITSAYLEFTANVDDTDAATINIAAQDVDSAPAFDSSNKDLSDRALTASSVDWSPGSWSNNQSYSTADISEPLEEVIARAGWEAGNDVVFVLEHTAGGRRRADSHDGEASNSPRLVLTYTTFDYSPSLRTVKADLKSIIDSEIIASGSTPIVETYLEAARYFMGEGVLYGKNRSSDSSYDNNTRVSSSDSWLGGALERDTGCDDSDLNSEACKTEYISGSPVYTTPMTDSCQENHIVLLTDGDPTSGNDAVSYIEHANMTGESCTDVGDGDKKCGEELAEYLFQTDLFDGEGELSGIQNISTHTIALIGGGSSWLENIATKGGGGYYSITGDNHADVVSRLSTAFNEIVGNVLDVDTSFVAPAVAINQFNRLTHREEIYYAVFRPQATPKWPGNLKKFGLSGSDVTIVDQNDNPAVDVSSGSFKTSSQSYWSAAVDGNDVTLGGAASKLPSDTDSRNIYFHLSSTADGTALATESNSFDITSDNASLTKALLGLVNGETDDYRTGLINWIRGQDIKDEDGDGDRTENRYSMGDPLHSRPLVVTYDADPNGDDDPADAEYYLFFGTNEGLLHAVDGRTGVEKFAIAPGELLDNFDTFYQNIAGVTRPYGLDGESTVWVKDVDADGKIEKADGDHIYLYVGMRRGGRGYYAYDITEIDNPKLKWQINNNSTNLADLGQSWSKPLLTKVNYKDGGSVITKEVLVFAGGYDPAQDDRTTREVDGMGNAIFMVEAETGNYLWSAGDNNTDHTEVVSEMKYGIPSRLAGADVNGDGTLDELFFGDMGGQVFRIRFDNSGSLSLSAFATVTRIADLAADSSTANTRRFYHGADIALTRSGGDKYLTIVLGSGFRAHPLSSGVTDRFYAIKQPLDVVDIIADPDNDLYDATANDIQDGDASAQTAAKTALASGKGWYIDMENTGEKVLSRPLVIDGKVVFTTYEPTARVVGCTAVPGQSREYIVSLLDASAVVDFDNIDGLTKDDRSSDLNIQGIVDDTVVVITEDGIGAFQGTQKSGLDLGSDRAIRTFWYQE